MSEPVMIAVISAVGLVLSGVLVELVRARKRQETVVSAVTPNSGSSMRDIVARIETDMREMRAEVHQNTRETRAEVHQNTVRLATVEARLSEHLINAARRRSTDG